MKINRFFLSLLFYFITIIPNFAHDDIKCLTFPIRKNEKLKEQIQSIVNFDSTGRPKNQCVAISPNRLFAVHYDTSGPNKVPPLDVNHNGIPDYVDSALYYLERAYYFYVDTLGFDPPPTDSGRGGGDEYDFYLWEIGNGFYEEVAYGWTVCDLEITTPNIYSKYACFSVIDNDYSPNDTTFFTSGNKRQTYRETGFLGLKITTAHELHHLFQFGYGDPLFPSINEMTSTFMEWRVWPETKDYLQFVKSLFSDFSKYILSDPTYYVGYRYAIFLQYIQKRFGDQPIVELWRNIGRGNNPMLSLELALKQKGSSLSESVANFLPYLYYSGTNSKPNYLPNAELFPPIKYNYENVFDGSLLLSQRLKPLEIRPLRIFFPAVDPETLDDTLVILLANIDSKNAIQQFLDSLKECTIVLSKTNSSGIQLYPREIYYDLLGEKNLIADSLYLSFGFKTYTISYAFPNPWRKGKEPISFPVPDKVSLKDVVDFRIYDSHFQEIPLPTNKQNVSIVDKRRVIHFDTFPIELSSGVYFFKVKFEDSEVFGKFSVID
ncbi:hypothetical protein D9V84_05210 [Bacteroidetes/Chlorobi group bacterium Naka2016]|jgi:hypothetical protein|nr:MAG: hypothetical protein D9V84_05210 [Bacteroidetes/Chlorobi group bacterium Naka2016]